MPHMVNQSGLLTFVNGDDESMQAAFEQGLRLADDDDYNISVEDKSAFSIPNIERYERGYLDDLIMLVVGCGPSQVHDIPGAYRIQINPRPDAKCADAVLALDGEYWRSDMWQQYIATEPMQTRFAPRGVPDQPTDVSEFKMPVQASNKGNRGLIEVRTKHGIRNANLSTIAGVLVARYLSTGPIVLLGMDLTGGDQGGTSYEARQFPMWEIVAPLMDGVYVHHKQGGRLRELFPSWKTESSDTDWCVLGGGKSADKYLPEMLDKGCSVITCNAGLQKVANPDVYICTDPNARITYREAYKRAASFDVDVLRYNEGITYDMRDTSYHGRSSGIICIREAIKRGARRIHILGCDGFKPDEMEYKAHGRSYNRHGMNEAMTEAFERLFKEFPDVEFTWYGKSLLVKDSWPVKVVL